MRYRLLGRSGLRVSELMLGTMTFGEDWGWGASKEVSASIFEAFAEAGGNFLDTADIYTNGNSERILGELIAKDRDRFVVGTKYVYTTDPTDPNAAGSHRKNLVRSLEQSLRRLNTDHIDVFWVHFWDPYTPIAETMRALDDAVRAGKVLSLGVSDTPAWVIARANTIAEAHGWTPFSALQCEYSLLGRSPEREHLPMCQHLDMAVTAWGALASGMLTGKYADPEAKGRMRTKPYDRLLRDEHLPVIETVLSVAAQLDADPSQVALSWLRGRGDNVIPIVSASRVEQFRVNLRCLDVELPDDARRRLDEVSAIDMGFPRTFVAGPTTAKAVFGRVHNTVDTTTPPV